MDIQTIATTVGTGLAGLVIGAVTITKSFGKLKAEMAANNMDRDISEAGSKTLEFVLSQFKEMQAEFAQMRGRFEVVQEQRDLAYKKVSDLQTTVLALEVNQKLLYAQIEHLVMVVKTVYNEHNGNTPEAEAQLKLLLNLSTLKPMHFNPLTTGQFFQAPNERKTDDKQES